MTRQEKTKSVTRNDGPLSASVGEPGELAHQLVMDMITSLTVPSRHARAISPPACKDKDTSQRCSPLPPSARRC